MATFDSRITLAGDTTLATRIQVAVVLTALSVAAEPRPDATASMDERASSNLRRSFARSVISDPTSVIPHLRWVLACTSFADLPTPSDDDLLAAVAGVWDALAGA